MSEAAARPSLRRPVTLLVASAVAIVGIVLVLVSFASVGTQALAASQTGDVPCLEAVDAGTHRAKVNYEVLPPRATCTWTDDAGTTATVVTGEAAPGRFWFGAGLLVAGVLTCAGMLLAPRLRR